jgi:hypothetical protein
MKFHEMTARTVKSEWLSALQNENVCASRFILKFCLLHDMHLRTSCINLSTKSFVWWPKMDMDIKKIETVWGKPVTSHTRTKT